MSFLSIETSIIHLKSIYFTDHLILPVRFEFNFSRFGVSFYVVVLPIFSFILFDIPFSELLNEFRNMLIPVYLFHLP